MYIGNHQLNDLIGNDLSKSVWSFLSRQLNCSKQILSEYDAICKGVVHHRRVMVKGYDVDTIIETICEHASSYPDSKSVWVRSVEHIKDKLYEFKLKMEALDEMDSNRKETR